MIYNGKIQDEMESMALKTTVDGVDGVFYPDHEHDKLMETVETLKETVSATREILKDVFGSDKIV